MLDLCGFCHNVKYRAEIIYKQHLKTLAFLFLHSDSTQDVCRGILMYLECCVTHDDACLFHEYQRKC